MTSIILFFAGTWMLGFGWFQYEFDEEKPTIRACRIFSFTGLIIMAFAVTIAVHGWIISR